jgi:hypothetical protein
MSCFRILLERTHGTALEEMLKMTTIFLKTSIHTVIHVTLWSVLGPVLATQSVQYCVSVSSKLLGLFKNEHVLLVNTPCLHLHSFYTTCMSSSLVTKVPMTQVSWGRLGESIPWVWACFWIHFYAAVNYCSWVTFWMVHPIYFLW